MKVIRKHSFNNPLKFLKSAFIYGRGFSIALIRSLKKLLYDIEMTTETLNQSKCKVV